MRLIDADALHERIAQVRNRRKKAPDGIDDLFVRGLNFAEGLLFEAPTVDVERHGKWLNANGDYSEAVCSKCGWRIETEFGGTGSKIVFNAVKKTLHYCSNCGAKMEEDANNE